MPTEPTTNPQVKPPSHTPRNHEIFDPWNSASTGHQRAENPYSNTTAWRDTRARKLERQFKSGDCGSGAGETGAPAAFDGTVGSLSSGESGSSDKGRVSGAGEGAGEWRWVSGDEATRSQLGVRDIRSFMSVGKRKEDGGGGEGGGQLGKRMKLEFQTSVREEGVSSRRQTSSSSESGTTSNTETETVTATDDMATTNTQSSKEVKAKQVFSGTTIYVNGSTLPRISDHKLKHLLVSHGARISIAMARKTVSHIIVGQPGVAGIGAGGGLSARKLQQEIERGGWRGVKVVGVDW